MSTKTTKGLSPEQQQELLGTLESRFEKNMKRQQGIEWSKVQAKLQSIPQKIWSLSEMERTGGEPDVVAFDQKTGEYLFFDCATETPIHRRNTCYDRSAQQEREKKGVFPQGNALDMAEDIGIELLTEEQYRLLQEHGNFDTKTSSWLKTPPDIRKAGGALFADRRYGHVFVYHNSAPSFYAVRGFRGLLKV